MLNLSSHKLIKTATYSLLAIEIIDFASKTLANQTDIKSLLNSTINLAMIDIPLADYVIVDTLSGTTIAYCGPLQDALENALFIAITIRDEIHKNNAQTYRSIYVQFGISLGAARLSESPNVPASLVGEGVEDAKRIASFANPNQILASLDYVEEASKLTDEIAQMFEKYEMHAHHQDVYAVRLLKDKSTDNAIDAANTPINQTKAGKINWLLVGTGLMVLTAFFALVKMVSTPVEPLITIVQPTPSESPKRIAKLPEAAPKIEPSVVLAEPTDATQPDTEQRDTAQHDTAQRDTAQRDTKKQVQLVKLQNSKTQDLPHTVANSTFENPNLVKVVQKTALQKTPVQKPSAQKAATNTARDKNAKPVELKPVELKPVESKPVKSNSEVRTFNSPPVRSAEIQVEKQTDKNASKQKSGWQTFKDSVTTGTDIKCTQAEIALNQCNK